MVMLDLSARVFRLQLLYDNQRPYSSMSYFCVNFVQTA